MGWLGEAKVSCILRQTDTGLQFSKACYPLAGKGRRGMFLFHLFFIVIHFPFSPVPLFHIIYYLFCLSSPFLWERTQNDSKGLTCG